MAKPNNTCKEEKKKMAVRVAGGDGVGAAVVWGGCVVIAILASISAIRFRKNRKRPDRNDRSNNKDFRNKNEEQGGLRVLLRHSSPPVDGLPSADETMDMCATKTDTTISALTKSLILDNPVIDKKPTYLEILLSDNSRPESNSIILDVNKNVPKVDLLDVQVTEIEAEDKITERSHAAQLAEENPPLTQLIGRGELEENDAGETMVLEMEEEGIQTFLTNQFALEDNLEASGVITEEEQEHGLAETITERGEELEVREQQENKVADSDKTESQNPRVEWMEVDKEADETVKIGQVAVEDELQVTSSNEDDDEICIDENREEDVPEAGEEGSEGTGDSSMESNAEAVWPAESIQDLSLELKELKIRNQTLEEYRRLQVEEINEDTGKSEVTSNKGKAKEILAGINLSVWMLSTAILVAALLLMVPHLISPANIFKLCFIVFLVLILFHV